MKQLGLDCGGRWLDLSSAQVMGILNVTPDSFSDGGQDFDDQSQTLNVDHAVARAFEMVEQGATLIDIGGESTRPGAEPVTLEQELARVVPVIEALVAKKLPAVISVDTSSPEVMTAAVAAGAGLINDVRALQRPGALEAAAKAGVPVCLMHMKGQPKTMQAAPAYEQSVVDEVAEFLTERVDACIAAGIAKENIILDPGFGFGKTLAHNLLLLNKLSSLHQLALPLLVGTSRKSMIGQVLDKEVDQRLYGSLATVTIAVMQDAKIIRVHDVAQTYDVVRMTEAVKSQRP